MFTKRKCTRYVILFFLLGCMPGCEKWQKRTPQDGKVPLTFNYDSLRNRAEAFVPAIGVRGGTVTIPLYIEPVTFNPIIVPGAVPYMYEGLVRINGATGQPEPCLAHGWDKSDNGLVWTFYLRKDVLWSDSVPFTAYDVVFTFNEIIYNRKVTKAAMRNLFFIDEKQIAFNALDSFSIQCILPRSYAPFLTLLSQEIMPEHAYQRMVRGGFFSDSLNTTTSPERMTGTGPYLLASYASQSNIVLKRNPFYWRRDTAGNQLPYIDTLSYVLVSDLDDALQGFKNGILDYFTADGVDYKSLDEKDSNYTLYHLGPAQGSTFFLFNQNAGRSTITGKPYLDTIKQAWFRNRNFRKAIAFAVNKERMRDICMNGRGYDQWSPLNPSAGFFYNPDVVHYPYDLKKADTLLMQEGFRDVNNDGFLEDKDGHAVTFSCMVNTGNSMRKNMADIMVMDLERLGIKVQVHYFDAKIIAKKLGNPSYDWDMALLGLTDGPEPHLGVGFWCSYGEQHYWFPLQEHPATGWEVLIDSLFAAGSRETEPYKRKEIYSAWQYVISDEAPVIFTVQSERIACVSKRLGNVNATVHGGVLGRIEELFVKNEIR